jgi:hypothetical protein
VVSLCINSTSFDETVSLTKTISANAMQQSNLDVEEATMGDETVLCLV